MDNQNSDKDGMSRGLRRIYENVTTYQEKADDTLGEITQLKQMLVQKPDNNDIKEWLAFKLYSVGQYGEAEGYFRDLIASGHRAGVQNFYLGNLLSKTGREKQALDCWKQVIALIPDDVKAKKAAARIEKMTGVKP